MVSISRADYLMRFMTVNAVVEIGLVGLTAIFTDRLVFEPADPFRKGLEEFFTYCRVFSSVSFAEASNSAAAEGILISGCDITCVSVKTNDCRNECWARIVPPSPASNP